MKRFIYSTPVGVQITTAPRIGKQQPMAIVTSNKDVDAAARKYAQRLNIRRYGR